MYLIVWALVLILGKTSRSENVKEHRGSTLLIIPTPQLKYETEFLALSPCAS